MNTDELVREVHKYASRTLGRLWSTRLLNREKHPGVMFNLKCVVDGVTHDLAEFGIGTFEADDGARFAGFADEKNVRLIGHAEDGHVLSFQSKDEPKGMYQGAVRSDEDSNGDRFVHEGKSVDFIVMSASACDQDVDEAVVLLVLPEAGAMPVANIFVLIDIGKNYRFGEITG